jgi:hypothetical protein
MLYRQERARLRNTVFLLLYFYGPASHIFSFFSRISSSRHCNKKHSPRTVNPLTQMQHIIVVQRYATTMTLYIEHELSSIFEYTVLYRMVQLVRVYSVPVMLN